MNLWSVSGECTCKNWIQNFKSFFLLLSESKGSYIEGEVSFGNFKKNDIDFIDLELVENELGHVHPNIIFVTESERKKKKNKKDKNKSDQVWNLSH